MDSHLKKLQRALSDATEGMSAEERAWHPAGKWCVDEVLEHLYLTYTGTIRGAPRALEAGKPPSWTRDTGTTGAHFSGGGAGLHAGGAKGAGGSGAAGLGGGNSAGGDGREDRGDGRDHRAL